MANMEMLFVTMHSDLLCYGISVIYVEIGEIGSSAVSYNKCYVMQWRNTETFP